MKYRKKPVIIDAFKVCDLIHTEKQNWSDLPACILQSYERGDFNFVGRIYVEIKTLEGWMKGNYDDYIIRGVQGELYPCKPDIFRDTYEPVDDEIAAVEG